jgi:Domain of unknown function (DUF4166)
VRADAEVSQAETWFGPAFAALHPQLQALHRDGGRLIGPVAFETGRGLAGVLGRIALWRIGIDLALSTHTLTVEIRHDRQGLRWARRFDDGREFVSLFKPHGQWPEGYWIERAGPLVLKLNVDFADGGWRWRPLQYRLFGLPLPFWLWPQVEAGKRIVDDVYRFDIRIGFRGIGMLLTYGGDLRLQPVADTAVGGAS